MPEQWENASKAALYIVDYYSCIPLALKGALIVTENTGFCMELYKSNFYVKLKIYGCTRLSLHENLSDPFPTLHF